jgi:DNA-3-methyladenine glycosylase II
MIPSRSVLGLTPTSYQACLGYLAEKDEDLKRILTLYGPPPIWERKPGFTTLVRIILEQQVSLASADAAFKHLINAVSPLEPESFLELDDAALKTIGFSRQKTHYCRELAIAIMRGHLDLDALKNMDDQSVRKTLVALKGIGPWTAEIYLLMVLLRPDAWPQGDLALLKAIRNVKLLPSLPTNEQAAVIASAWRPYRAVAARLLWFSYLEGRDI